MKSDEKTNTKKSRRTITVIVIILIVFILLLFYRPLYRQPYTPAEEGLVSPYLTNVLLPQLYNGSQLQEPFDVNVIEDGINQAVACSDWPRNFNAVTVNCPYVAFKSNRIILTASVILKGVEFSVSAAITPRIVDNKLLSLKVNNVKIGSIIVTPIAKIVAQNIYKTQLAQKKSDPNYMRFKIASALIENKPFDPVFDISGKKIRLTKICLKSKRLELNFAPVSY